MCEECEGKRFTAEVLALPLRGKNISEVLGMSVAEARDVLHRAAGPRRCSSGLADVGLGYISLGQPLNTLSGGERQRIKLAIEMAEADADVYVLDEPTTGLHMADVDKLLGLLDRLVDAGSTVIVIEHNLDVDRPRRLGHRPRSGCRHDGGQVVFEGTPAELCASGTLTGEHLAAYVAAERHTSGQRGEERRRGRSQR